MKLIKKWVFLLLLIAVFAITLVAASENSSEVSLYFLEYESFTWPVSWWMLSAFVGGVLFGSLLNLFSNTRLRLRHRAAEKKVVLTARELDAERARSQTQPMQEVDPVGVDIEILPSKAPAKATEKAEG
jgi:uncharacterized integral membrane protein